MTLTKAQLIDSISTSIDRPKAKSSELVESLLDSIKSTLENGEDVLLSGFGKFCVREKKEQRGRNSATGEDLMLEPWRVITFKPSGKLRDRMNGNGSCRFGKNY